MQIEIRLYCIMRFYFLIPLAFFLLLIQPLYSQEQDTDYDIYNTQMSLEEQLLTAAFYSDTAKILQMIASGVKVNATTYEGVSSIMYAAQNGNTGIVKILLSNGADPNLSPSNGNTALISAIRSGYMETAEFLIRNGADMNEPDEETNTPLMHAIVVDSFYLPDMLLYYDAAFDLHNKDGADALMMASWFGRYEIVKLLIEKGADINSCDKSNWTPLHYATAYARIEIMDLLILNGASLEIKTSKGYSPLSLAVANNNFSAARLLIGYGADVNSRINSSLNPLTLALDNKNDSLVRMLMNQDAKEIYRPNFDKYTFGSRFLFNRDDNRLDFSFGLSDSRYNLMASLGFGFRPKAAQVLKQVNDSTFYQYWERRYYISFVTDKAIYLPLGRSSFRIGAFGGLSEVLTFGGYRGSKENSDIRLVISPRIGGIIEYGFLRLKVNYEFMNLRLAEVGNGWVNASLDLMINRNNRRIRIP